MHLFCHLSTVYALFFYVVGFFLTVDFQAFFCYSSNFKYSQQFHFLFDECIFKCCNFPFYFSHISSPFLLYYHCQVKYLLVFFVSLTFFSIVHFLFFWTLHLKSDSYMAIKKVQTRQSRNVLKYDFTEPDSLKY